MQVWDAGTKQLVHTIADAHERVPHALVLNSASAFVAHPSGAHFT